MTFEKGQPFFEYARTAAGAADMAVKGDATPVVYEFGPDAAGQVLAVERVIIYMEDAKVDDGGKFGGATAPGVGEGIIMQRVRGGVVVQDLLDGEELRTNNNLRRTCHDADPIPWSGGGNESLTARWTFGKSGIPITLNGITELLRVTIRGDLSSLDELMMNFQGTVIEA